MMSFYITDYNQCFLAVLLLLLHYYFCSLTCLSVETNLVKLYSGYCRHGCHATLWIYSRLRGVLSNGIFQAINRFSAFKLCNQIDLKLGVQLWTNIGFYMIIMCTLSLASHLLRDQHSCCLNFTHVFHANFWRG